jgi:hypothetical protein
VSLIEVSSFHRAISTENSSLGPDEVSLFHRMSSFHRVAIHRFHCISNMINVFKIEKKRLVKVGHVALFGAVEIPEDILLYCKNAEMCFVQSY